MCSGTVASAKPSFGTAAAAELERSPSFRMNLLSLFRKKKPEPVKKSPLEWIAFVWKDTADILLTLNRWQSIAYAYVICCRFHPAYERFYLRLGHGSPETLVSIRQLLVDVLRDKSVDMKEHQRLNDAIFSLHENEEDELSEDSDAIDALSVHAAALDVVALDTQQVLWLMDACYSLADRKAMDIVMPEAGTVTTEIEAKVRNSEPMKLERTWQHSLIETLAKCTTLEELEDISNRCLQK